jgi:hypothetical protein
MMKLPAMTRIRKGGTGILLALTLTACQPCTDDAAEIYARYDELHTKYALLVSEKIAREAEEKDCDRN